jgi:hypothetical protein
MSQKLVIVESPAKARTIEKFLGKDYKVLASYGHVRALPSKQGSVDIEKDFEPNYAVLPDSKKHIQAIKKELKNSSSLLLATDPDREGEAISWHLLAALGLGEKKKTKMPSSMPSRTRATLHWNWWMPSRPVRYLTILSASTSPRTSGKRFAMAYRQDVCSQLPSD